jgi:hypothetical protein
MLVAIFLGAAVWTFVEWIDGPGPFRLRDKPISYVEVKLTRGAEHTIRITDPEQIESLIVRPLGNSTKRRRVLMLTSRGREQNWLGSIYVQYEDGASEDIRLAVPWGLFWGRGAACVADLSLLRDACRRDVEASGPAGEERLSHAEDWELLK